MNITPGNTLYSEFRRRCEDKNTLTKKGSLYVGTGVINNGVYETEELAPPTNLSVLSVGNNGDLDACWVSDVYKHGYVKITSGDYLDLLTNNGINKNIIYVIVEE